jgi:hypothetical protein
MQRTFRHRTWLLLATVAGLTLGACSNASSSSGGSGNSGRASAEATGRRASASSIDACRLLTKNEIQQQLGAAVDDGKLQTTDSQASCDWTGTADDGVGLTVRVQNFDQNLWNSFTSSDRATPVSGLGDAAFANVPLRGGVMIRQSTYEIDVGVVDFRMSNDRAVAAAKALAALVLPRVSSGAQGAK